MNTNTIMAPVKKSKGAYQTTMRITPRIDNEMLKAIEDTQKKFYVTKAQAIRMLIKEGHKHFSQIDKPKWKKENKS